MNKGEKVLCTKDFTLNKLRFVANETYMIYSENKLEVYVTTNIDIQNCGCWFGLDNNRGFVLRFSDYFVLLAEWREKQIKSIIDD